MFWFSLQTSSKIFIILKSIRRDIILNVRTSSHKAPVILHIFKWNSNLLHIFSKNPQTSNFVKIRPVGAELFYVNGQTDGRRDITELMVPFRNFAKAPKNIRKGQGREVVDTSCKIVAPDSY